MKFSKFVSGVASLAIAAGAFAGFAVTASAATKSLLEYGTSDVPWTAENIQTVFGSSTEATLDETYGAKLTSSSNSSQSTSTTISPTADSIITLDAVWYGMSGLGRYFSAGNYSYFRFGNIYIMQNDQDKASAYMLTNDTSKMTTFSTGGFTYRQSDLSAAVPYTIHMEIDTASNTLKSLTVSGTETAVELSNVTLTNADYSTVAIGYQKAGSIKTQHTEVLKSIKITEETQSVTKAAYNVKYYKDSVADANLVKTVSDTGVVGDAPQFSKDVFEQDDTRYFYKSDDSEGVTIAADGSTVVNVIVYEARSYDASLVSSIDNSTISSKSDMLEGDTVDLYYHKYVVDGSKLYSAGSNDNQYFYTMSYAEPTKTIEYSEVSGTKVAFFSECEDIDGLTEFTDTARMSYGKGGTGTATVTTLPAGKYVVTIATRYTSTSGDHTYTVTAGDSPVLTGSAAGYIEEKSSDEFELTADTAITLTSDAACGVDYILIKDVSSADLTATYVNTYEGTGNYAGTYASVFTAALSNVSGSVSSVAVKSGDTTVTKTSGTDYTSPVLTDTDTVIGIIVDNLDATAGAAATVTLTIE